LEQHRRTAQSGGAAAVLVAVTVGFVGQLIRLQQTDPLAWLAADYLMRIVCLAILAVPPMLRKQVYAHEWRDVHFLEMVFWALTVALTLWVTEGIWPLLAALIPAPRLGNYPELRGLPRLFDLTFGLALVAIEEELLWRRAMRIALVRLGDGGRMVLVSAVLFGAYHWWRGGPTILGAAVFGGLAMQFYRRTGVLWPMVVLHYCMDLAIFA
jgi:membrane protease YdiL (CAAX protease family)